MVKIEATLDRALLERASEAIQTAGATGLTVSEARVAAGSGRQIYRGSMHGVFRSMLRLEVALEEDQLDEVLNALCAVLKESASFDTQIFVLPMPRMVTIRTGA